MMKVAKIRELIELKQNRIDQLNRLFAGPPFEDQDLAMRLVEVRDKLIIQKEQLEEVLK